MHFASISQFHFTAFWRVGQNLNWAERRGIELVVTTEQRGGRYDQELL